MDVHGEIVVLIVPAGSAVRAELMSLYILQSWHLYACKVDDVSST
jgi:hypothetical protein